MFLFNLDEVRRRVRYEEIVRRKELRDKFALAVLDKGVPAHISPAQFGEYAYAIADSMLAAREAGQDIQGDLNEEHK